MAKRKVPRGFLVTQAQNPKDGYVPFLINVREEEIIWNDKKEIIPFINQFVKGEQIIKEDVTPGYDYRIIKDGWACEIKPDGLITASKSIRIDETFDVVGEGQHLLRREHIMLPCLVFANQFLNIQVTTCSTNSAIAFAKANVALPVITTWNDQYNRKRYGYREFQLDIYNPDVLFSITFEDVLRESSVFVTVRACLPLSIYTENQPL